jgi:hypothetical protein
VTVCFSPKSNKQILHMTQSIIRSISDIKMRRKVDFLQNKKTLIIY